MIVEIMLRYKESPRQGKPQLGQWTVLGKTTVY